MGSSRGTCSSFGKGAPATRLPRRRAFALQAYRGWRPGAEGSSWENHRSGRRPEAAELEQTEERASARDLPIRFDPILAAPGRQHQAAIDGALGRVGQVDEDGRPGAPTAAALHGDMEFRAGVPEALGPDLHGQARPLHGLAALELADLEIDAAREEGGQRALDPLRADEPLQVSERTAGVLEELQIRAGRVLVDARPDDARETGPSLFRSRSSRMARACGMSTVR